MTRELPTRIAIGTQKAGSTYLYNLLKSHPDVALSELTEVNFYSHEYQRGGEWYQKTFPDKGVAIDISPKYFMLGREVAPRIKETLKDQEPRFLLLLRNPVDNLNSHFQMQIQQGLFTDTKKYPKFTTNLVDFVEAYPEYLMRAKYHEVLQTFWLPHFPVSCFNIVIFEEFIHDTDRVMNDILTFWGLEPRTLTAPETSKNRALRNSFVHRMKDFVIRFPRLKNYLKESRWFNQLYQKVLTTSSTTKLSDTDRKKLLEYFTKDIAQMEALLGRHITQWKK